MLFKKNKINNTIKTYDSISKEYDEELNYIYYQKELDDFVALLPKGAKILDAGCGNGLVSKYLQDKGFDVVGIDSSPNMLQFAQKRCPKTEFFNMDIRKIDFEVDTFDAIFCYAVLIHVSKFDCKKVIDKFVKILKPNGILFINVMEEYRKNENMYIPEPFNNNFKTFFQFYPKNFFENNLNKNFEILKITDRLLNDKCFENDNSFGRNEFSVYAKKIK